MKDPKDMTREELADALADIEYPLTDIEYRLFVEAANRLRKSIDRPKVEVVHDHVGQVWRLLINGTVIVGSGYTQGDLYARTVIEGESHAIRLALGMEGGEG